MRINSVGVGCCLIALTICFCAVASGEGFFRLPLRRVYADNSLLQDNVPNDVSFEEEEWPEQYSLGFQAEEPLAKESIHNYDDVQFIANVSIGSNRQPFRVVFDTGSSDFWVVGPKCRSYGCKGKPKFSPSESKSYKPTSYSLAVRYGTGEMSGSIGKDDVEIVPGLVVEQQTFAQADGLTDFFHRLPLDGLLGLAFPKLAHGGMQTVLETLRIQSKLRHPVFSFYLSSHPGSDNSEIAFGDVNPAFAQGPVFWTNVVEPKYWTLNATAVSWKGQEFCPSENCRAVIDTGTSLMLLPPKEGKDIIKAIGEIPSNCEGVDQMPPIIFEIDGHKIPVPSWSYVIKTIDKDDPNTFSCRLGIKIGQPRQWLLGDSFMRAFYTIFHYEKRQVGLIPLPKSMAFKK